MIARNKVTVKIFADVDGEKRYDSSIPKATINLTPQKSVLPLETMSQFAETVIPDELLFAGRDPWFDRPFDRLTVLSKVEGRTTLSEVEGESSVGSI